MAKILSKREAPKGTTSKVLPHKAGDLQVWWIPQVPGKPFTVPVKNLSEGTKLLEVLADYDAFQFKNKIKPDYCNAGGLQCWCNDSDGNGNPGWEDWHDEETGMDLDEWLAEQDRNKT